MNEVANGRVSPMPNPPHLGKLVRESMDELGWNVTEAAERLGCERGTLSRLLNGKAGLSANMALALEEIGHLDQPIFWRDPAATMSDRASPHSDILPPFGALIHKWSSRCHQG